MTITALKPNAELNNFRDYNPFWPSNPTLPNIQYLLFETSLLRLARQHDGGGGGLDDSFARRVGVCCLCHRADPLPRFALDGSGDLLAYLVPPSILFIPLAVMIFKFGIYDTKLALIFTYPTFLIPFCLAADGLFSLHPL